MFIEPAQALGKYKKNQPPKREPLDLVMRAERTPSQTHGGFQKVGTAGGAPEILIQDADIPI